MKKRKENEKLMFLALMSFLLIASTAISISVEKKKKSDVKAIEPEYLSKNLAPIPRLTNSAEFPILSAQGALIIDLNSMVPLYEKNPDQELLPASTTKTEPSGPVAIRLAYTAPYRSEMR